MISRPAPGLGWHSLRGRYLYLATAFTLLLLIAAGLADHEVKQAAFDAAGNVQRRSAMRVSLAGFAHDLRRAEVALQYYLLLPTREAHDELEGAVAVADRSMRRLHDTELGRARPSDAEAIKQIAAELAQVRAQVGRLVDVRAKPELLFPAMPIMVERLLPTHTRFRTAAGLALSRLEGQALSAEQAEVYQLFAEARYASAQMVATFRVWIANRFGIFGEPETAMRIQAGNLRLYAESVEHALKRLTQLERRGLFDLQQSTSLQQMRRLHAQWVADFQQVAAIVTSDHWRADIPILRDMLQPLFDRISSRLRALDSQLQQYSADDLSALARVGERLSNAIWLLATLGIGLSAVGYLLFELGVRRPVALVVRALKDEADGRTGAISFVPGTVETRELFSAFDEMRSQVHSRQQRLETILEHAAEGIITFGETGIIERFNKAAERLFGHSEAEIIGKSIETLIVAPDDGTPMLDEVVRTESRSKTGAEKELTGRHKDGGHFAMALNLSRIAIEGRLLYTALVADISDRQAMLDHLKNVAEHDGLTGLYNRTYFQQELERTVERARRAAGFTAALLYVDLDNFKYVNDTLGHAAGDRLLIEVAGILHKRARKSDLIARFGGDEFTVLLYNTTPELAQVAAESFRKKLASYRFRHEGEQVDLGCSVGVAPLGPDTVSAEGALSQADLACHLAKRNGRNQVHVYRATDAEKVTTMSAEMGWFRRIKEAIAQDRFLLARQPIVNTRTRQVEAYEVLIRLRDENDGIIMPAGFLSSAERFGLAADVDRWVIVHAIEALQAERRFRPDLRYSINLSGQTITQPAVCDLIQQKLRETGLEANALLFEVTETVAIADMAAAQDFLARLQATGCRTALDDFGSGMSSFAYLRELPVDCVKIDGRFVRHLSTNPVDQAMLRGMNQIVHALGKQTIAEFVEDERAFALLMEYGIDYAQGYYLGRPEIFGAVPDGNTAGDARSVNG